MHITKRKPCLETTTSPKTSLIVFHRMSGAPNLIPPNRREGESKGSNTLENLVMQGHRRPG